jgi:hypothetical protein
MSVLGTTTSGNIEAPLNSLESFMNTVSAAKNLQPIAELANNVTISQGCRFNDGFIDSIATIEQKLANNYQFVLAADSYDVAEFGANLKATERLVRVTTPMADPTHQNYRSIAKLDLARGTIAWADSDKYELGVIAWSRALKCKFINVDSTSLGFFGFQ